MARPSKAEIERWTPVEAAVPPRGVEVWGWDSFYERVIVVYHNGRWWESDSDSDIGITHWQGIEWPDPPKSTSG